MFLLDTDVCSYVMKRRSPALVARVRGFEPGELKVSSVTVFELAFGARRSGRFDEIDRIVRAFLANVETLPFDFAAADEAGAVRAELAGIGQPIGAYDLLIAGHARSLGAVLVTHNTRELTRVQGLQVEDWTI
jgi:tRNA(fMet)-specific endonuclease VapC